ncbi:AraC family transcriptional regulator [Streptomyces microflavus]|uniref:helix-turn-helix transcriptional regulator n=1 Tax=Streptomyces microflavus TaxID=1919 RepID=UPI00365E9DB3
MTPQYQQWMHYLTPGRAHHQLGLVCLGVGHQSGRLPSVGPRALQHHVAVVVTKGSGWLRLEGGALLSVQAPAVMWLRPGTVHHYGVHDQGWTEWFVDFTGTATAAYEDLGFIETGTALTRLTNGEPAARAISRIAHACRTVSPYLETEASALVHEVLVVLRHNRLDDFPQGQVILAALTRDACLPISVAEHAQALDLTVAELRLVVQRLTGSQPKNYLMNVRISRAKELLAGTDLTIAAIARRIGYSDPAYFTRVFTRHTRVPPSEFRDLHLNGNTLLGHALRETSNTAADTSPHLPPPGDPRRELPASH